MFSCKKSKTVLSECYFFKQVIIIRQLLCKILICMFISPLDIKRCMKRTSTAADDLPLFLEGFSNGLLNLARTVHSNGKKSIIIIKLFSLKSQMKFEGN